jgi:hypothetical protein
MVFVRKLIFISLGIELIFQKSYNSTHFPNPLMISVLRVFK